MNIQTLFNNVYRLFITSRQSGTTTLLKKIASENDCWILVPNEQVAKEFGDKAITFSELDNLGGYRCHNHKPILVDNYTMIQLSELGTQEFDDLSETIRNRNGVIQKIKRQLSEIQKDIEKIENDNT